MNAHAGSQDGAATSAAMVERGCVSTPPMRRIENDSPVCLYDLYDGLEREVS
jgi:hypothetical protein